MRVVLPRVEIIVHEGALRVIADDEAFGILAPRASTG
jgi:hypothetical protein